MSFFPDGYGCAKWSIGGDVCSGHGKCVEIFTNGTMIPADPHHASARCVCDPGWTGLADWINSNGYDCNQPILGIQIAIIINLCCCVPNLIYSIHKLILCYQRYRDLSTDSLSSSQPSQQQNPLPRPQKDRPRQLPRKTFWTQFFQLHIVQSSILALITSLSVMILLIRKLITGHVGGPVGTDIPTTFLCLVAVISFFYFVSRFIHSWIKLTLKLAMLSGENKRNAVAFVKRLQKILRLIQFYSVGLFCTGFVDLAVRDNYRAQSIATFIWCLGTCGWLILACSSVIFATIRIKAFLLTDLENIPPARQKERQAVVKRLNLVLRQARISGTQSTLVVMLFAWWPWLRPYFTFQFFFSGSSIQLVSALCLYVLALPGEDSVRKKTRPSNPGIQLSRTTKPQISPTSTQVDLMRASGMPTVKRESPTLVSVTATTTCTPEQGSRRGSSDFLLPLSHATTGEVSVNERSTLGITETGETVFLELRSGPSRLASFPEDEENGSVHGVSSSQRAGDSQRGGDSGGEESPHVFNFTRGSEKASTPSPSTDGHFNFDRKKQGMYALVESNSGIGRRLESMAEQEEAQEEVSINPLYANPPQSPDRIAPPRSESSSEPESPRSLSITADFLRTSPTRGDIETPRSNPRGTATSPRLAPIQEPQIEEASAHGGDLGSMEETESKENPSITTTTTTTTTETHHSQDSLPIFNPFEKK